MNGDIVDGHRRVQRPAERELVARLAELSLAWRSQGRRVVSIAGNHDARPTSEDPIGPDRWMLDFQTARGERVRVLHGHRFSASDVPWAWALYDRMGSPLLALENFVYGRVEALHELYRFGPGWPVAAIASLDECLACNAACSKAVSFWLSAFNRSGRFSVTRTMPSSTSWQSRSSLISSITFPRSRGRHPVAVEAVRDAMR